jgi:uncharacterized membrane protein
VHPIAPLALATAAFLLTHLVSGSPLRPKLVSALGEWPYRGLYSAAAFLTLGAMIWAYIGVPREPLWPGLRLLPIFVMPFAFVVIACGYFRNPTMVGADALLKSEDPARGLIRVTRHPIMWGVMLWALAHLLARGDAKALIFFGGFFVVAFLGSLSMDRRKRASPDFVRFAAVTSYVPFVAIAQGRNRLVWREIGWLRPAIGLAVFASFLGVHRWLFGVSPI